jgi:hypothetical protein
VRGRRAIRIGSLPVLMLLLAGCSVAERLGQIGRPPSLTRIENPTRAPGY